MTATTPGVEEPVFWDEPGADYLGDALREAAAHATITLAEGERRDLQEYLRRQLDPAVLSPFRGVPGRQGLIRDAIRQAIRVGTLPHTRTPTAALVDAIYAATVGLGPLEALIADPEITSITIPSAGVILCEKEGREYQVAETFTDEGHLMRVAESLVMQAGRTLSFDSPSVDLRFPPNLRVNVNILRSGSNAFIALRRGRPRAISLAEMVERGAIDNEVRDFLTHIIPAIPGVVVVGVPSTGKTTWLETLLGTFLEATGQRIVLCEDPPELHLTHPQVTQFEIPTAADGQRSNFDMEQVIATALRANARLLVVGELRRSQESATLLASASSMRAIATTLHGKTVELALKRFLSLVMSDQRFEKQSPRLVCDIIAGSFPLIIQTDILPNGQRLVRRISWLHGGTADGEFQLDDLFVAHASYEGSRLEITWERKAFTLPASMQEELLLHDRERAFSAQEKLTTQLAREAHQAMRDALWPRAVRLIEQILTHDPALFREWGAELREALRHARQWDTIAQAGASQKAQIEHLVREREWETLEGTLGQVKQQVRLRLVLEGELRGWETHLTQGVAATREAHEVRETAQTFESNHQYEAALQVLDSFQRRFVSRRERQAHGELRLRLLAHLVDHATEPERRETLRARLKQVAREVDPTYYQHLLQEELGVAAPQPSPGSEDPDLFRRHRYQEAVQAARENRFADARLILAELTAYLPEALTLLKLVERRTSSRAALPEGEVS